MVDQLLRTNVGWPNIKLLFFPNCTRLWNSLPYSVQNSENVSTFKNRLKQYFEQERNVRSPLKLEHFHDGFFGSLLTQIKLKLSPLRAQLFRYNLIDNPFCPSCGSAPETPMHFFLECQNYRGIREKFLFYLFKIDDTRNFKDNNAILDLIINGCHHSSIVKRSLLNKAIFRHVKIFIAMTERFKI